MPLRWRSSFLTARDALGHDDIATARPLFDEMAEALPGNVEVRLYAMWARARLAKSLGEREREEVDDLARRVLGSRQSLALPLCILAHAAVRRGELHVARNLFRHAALADPTLVDARRGFRVVDQRLSRPGTGRRTRSGPWFVETLLVVVALLVALMSVGAAARWGLRPGPAHVGTSLAATLAAASTPVFACASRGSR